MNDIKPLADLLDIDLTGTDRLTFQPERVDEGMEKRLNGIVSTIKNGESHILDGIEVLGKLMWCAGINPECKEIGQEFEHDLLRDGGAFVQALAEMLRQTITIKNNAQYDLQRGLEYRLKQGGVR